MLSKLASRGALTNGSEEHTSELQSRQSPVRRSLLETKTQLSIKNYRATQSPT